MAALHWMALGYGYEITTADVLAAYSFVLNAASAASMTEAQIKTQILDMITAAGSENNFVLATLRNRLIE